MKYRLEGGGGQSLSPIMGDNDCVKKHMSVSQLNFLES